MPHRGFTSWLVLLALFAGTVLPLHAGAHAWRADVVGRDLCTVNGAKPVPGAPDPAHADACATCFVCGGSAAAPGRAFVAMPVTPSAWLPVASTPADTCGRPHGRALARGPPAVA